MYFFLFFISSGFAFFNESRSTLNSFQILKKKTIATHIALSGAGVAYKSSPHSSMELNPANTSIPCSNKKISINQNFLPKEFKNHFISFYLNLPVFQNCASIGMNYLSFDPIDAYDEYGNNLSPYGAFSFAIQSNYSFVLQSLHIGTGLKYVLNNIETSNYYTTVLNLGIFSSLNSKWNIGVSFLNINLLSSQTSTGYQLKAPSSFQMGIRHHYLEYQDLNLNILSDVRFRSGESIHFLNGILLEGWEMVSMQIGFALSDRKTDDFLNINYLKSFSLGWGVKWLGISLNYGMAWQNILSSEKSINIIFDF